MITQDKLKKEKTDKLKEKFDKAVDEQFNGGEPYWPNWEGVWHFIQTQVIPQAKAEAYTHGMNTGYMERTKDLPKSYQKGRKDERKLIREKIKRMKKPEIGKTKYDCLENRGYNQAIIDILKQLEDRNVRR